MRKKNSNLKLSSLFTTLCCLTGLFFSSTIFAQTFPTSCSSKDLTLLTASLPAPAGDRCNCSGDRQLILGINNGTGSFRTSFALWGTLIRKNAQGTTIDSLPIFACTDSIQPKKDNFLPAKTILINGVSVSTIHINCGESLDIINMHLAWTSASPSETCEVLRNNPGTINPKCGTQDLIHVGIGVEASFIKTNATCTTLGSIKVKPSGGIAGYRVCLYKKNGANDSTLISTCRNVPANDSTTFNSLAIGDYTIRTTDNMSETDTTKRCFINKMTTVAQPDAVSKPAATVDQPTCNTATATVHVTSPVSGVTYTLTDVSNAANSYTANGSGNFLSVTANHTYTFMGSKGSCNTNGDNVIVNAQPATPDAPTADVTQPTCSLATGTIAVTGVQSNTTYTLTGPSPSNTTQSNTTGSFPGLASGTYGLTATKNGCTSGSTSKTVNAQPATPTFTVCLVNPTLCANSGSVTITALAGSGSGLEYSINNGTSWLPGNTFSSLASNSVSGIKVKNAAGCISTAATCSTSSTCPITTRVSIPTETITETQTTVKAYPNPFSDKVKFVVTSSVAGKGNLEVYNMMGQKVRTVYTGLINAGTQTFELSLPAQQISELIYVLRVGDKKTSGKILQINQ